eukprot:1500021-Pyramimonas_sp.AAC.1
MRLTRARDGPGTDQGRLELRPAVCAGWRCGSWDSGRRDPLQLLVNELDQAPLPVGRQLVEVHVHHVLAVLVLASAEVRHEEMEHPVHPIVVQAVELCLQFPLLVLREGGGGLLDDGD